jgi:hypothetical protein
MRLPRTTVSPVSKVAVSNDLDLIVCEKAAELAEAFHKQCPGRSWVKYTT